MSHKPRTEKLSSAAPMYKLDVKLSLNVLDSYRRAAKLIIYEDKLVIIFMDEGVSFELHNCTVRLFPNLDTLLVLGCDVVRSHDIYIFAASAHIRQKCVDVMSLLQFRIVDEDDHSIERPALTVSNSLPNLYRFSLDTIYESK